MLITPRASLFCKGAGTTYLNCGTGLQFTGSLSILTWCKMRSTAVAQRLVDTSGLAAAGWSFGLGVGSGNTFTVFAGKGGSTSTIYTGIYLENKWIQLGNIYNGSTSVAIINGVSANSISYSTNPTNAGFDFCIGGVQANTTRPAYGNISVTAVWNRAISIQEAQAFYRSGVIPYAPAGVWSLDDTNGTTMFDRSGNGYHGTMSSCLLSTDIPPAFKVQRKRVQRSVALI